PRVTGRFPKEAVEALERATPLAQPLLRELDRGAGVRAEQPEAQHVGGVGPHQPPGQQRVTQRPPPLLRAQIHDPVVDPAACERLSGRRLGLRDLALVVREDQILAATMDVERRAEIFYGHRRALDVPAGTSFAPRTGPRRLARFGRLPEGKVARIAFALVDLDAGAPEQLVAVLPGQTTVGRKSRDLEIDVTVDEVGDAGGHELLDEPDH